MSKPDPIDTNQVVPFNITPELMDLLTKDQRLEIAKYLSKQFQVKVEISKVYDILYSLATSDLTEFYEYDDELKVPVLKKSIFDGTMDPIKRQQIKSIDIDKTIKIDKSGVTTERIKGKVALHDKTKILDYVMKYFDMFGANRAGNKKSDKVEALLEKTRQRVIEGNLKLKGASSVEFTAAD